MKPTHPLARLVGTIIGHIIVALVSVTAITVLVALAVALINFWKILLSIGI